MAETSKPTARDVVVVGAGVVGVCCALKLQMEGHRVTVVDPRPPGTGTSFGNAGAIAVGSVFPTATPGIWKDVPKMLLDPVSPLRVDWRYMPRMLPWLLKFLAASTPSRVEAISHALRGLSKDGMRSHASLMKAHGIDGIVKPVGWLTVYPNESSFEKSKLQRETMARRGVNFDVLSADEIRQLEPNLSQKFTHGYHQPDNGFVTNPVKLTGAYAEAFERLGGRFVAETARRFEMGEAGPRRLFTDLGVHDADLFVVAAGAWSGRVSKLLGLSLPIDTERGYHLNLEQELAPELRRPVVIGDKGFVLAPMTDGLRLTSGVEFAGVDAPPDFRRIYRMLDMAKEALPGLDPKVTREWLGFRPAMPDSVPVIGPAPGMQNVLLAFGHSHIGLSLAARTAELIADLAAGREPDIDLAPYRAERF